MYLNRTVHLFGVSSEVNSKLTVLLLHAWEITQVHNCGSYEYKKKGILQAVMNNINVSYALIEYFRAQSLDHDFCC